MTNATLLLKLAQPKVNCKAWFPLSQFRPRQRPILSQDKAISAKDDCSITESLCFLSRCRGVCCKWKPGLNKVKISVNMIDTTSETSNSLKDFLHHILHLLLSFQTIPEGFSKNCVKKSRSENLSRFQ